MQSNATFATTPTADKIDTRESIFIELGGTSLEDLHKMLAVIHLRVTAAANNTSNQEYKDAEAAQNKPKSPQDKPQANTRQDHVGIFAQAYA